MMECHAMPFWMFIWKCYLEYSVSCFVKIASDFRGYCYVLAENKELIILWKSFMLMLCKRMVFKNHSLVTRNFIQKES
jgi:hypothetical protein